MPLTDDDERLIIRYLLGDQMPERQLERIEESFIHNDLYFDELQRLEDRLIADALAGHLPAQEAALFDQNFLASPRRRRAFEVQRGMRDFLLSARTGLEGSSSPAALERRRPVFAGAYPGLRLAWGSAALAGVLCVGLGVSFLRQRSEVAALRAQLESAGASPAELSVQRPLAAFLLLPGAQRGEQAGNRISPSPDASLVRLRLQTSRPLYPAYTATLELPDGSALWRQFRLQANAAGPFVELGIPVSLLPAGDYVITLTGTTDSGRQEKLPSYVFRVG